MIAIFYEVKSWPIRIILEIVFQDSSGHVLKNYSQLRQIRQIIIKYEKIALSLSKKKIKHILSKVSLMCLFLVGNWPDAMSFGFLEAGRVQFLENSTQW